MPGRTPVEAVDAFLDPLKSALACVGGAHFGVSKGGRGVVGETHSWVLNGNQPVRLSADYGLTAQMHYEIQDRGASLGDQRFKVSTRAYLYSLTGRDGAELIAAHCIHAGTAPSPIPHWHAGDAAITEHGVFLARAHIPSPRITLEWILRKAIEEMPGVEPSCDDWRGRLTSTEGKFWEYASWGEPTS